MSVGSGADGAARYFNRDLSWLEFNRRVLAQATDESFPLLERVKFLSIFSSNLDEFFMKRVGLMKARKARLGAEGYVSLDGRTADQILAAIRTDVQSMQAEQAVCWEERVRPALEEEGIAVRSWSSLSNEERERAVSWYRANVFPTLTPLAVDPGHRFPFISNLSENFGILLRRAGRSEPVFARVKVPTVLGRFVRVDDGEGARSGVTMVAVDEVVRHNLGELFPGLEIEEVLPFRVTRSAAVETDDTDESEDLIELVEEELRRRRFANALRLEVPPGSAGGEVLRFVMSELQLSDEDVYERGGPLEYEDLLELVSLSRPDLKDKKWHGVRPLALGEAASSVFEVVRERDVLVHHPYESFEDSVERFIDEASRDPDVVAIKQTLYRTSPNSPFVASLIRAAEKGKQVACLVEVRARFDESRNVRFARQLERAGVHVAYGKVGLKTHCKCSLVVRRETVDGRAGVRCYAHLGTGNYHPKTAQLYTDLGVLTADPAITNDVVKLFNVLTGHAGEQSYERLLVAPGSMRSGFNALIDREIELAKAGKPARIIAKMNQLEDRRMTERLYEASQAGVKVTAYVRGFCCLRPGVEGLSENIEIVSVVGRFLEHSRVFYFGAGSREDDPISGEFYIGSADWMYRNLNNRVEAACPVRDGAGRARLWELFEAHRRDARRAWELQPDGSWARRELAEGAPEDGPERAGTFVWLMGRAREGVGG